MSRRTLTTLAFALIALAATAVLAERYVPARWRHELSSTRLVGYKRGEYLVPSEIFTGTEGVDAVVKYSAAVKVRTFGEAFVDIAEYNSGGRRYKETLKVTLTVADDASELNAEFEHTVSENGKVILRFAGNTVLSERPIQGPAQ